MIKITDPFNCKCKCRYLTIGEESLFITGEEFDELKTFVKEHHD